MLINKTPSLQICFTHLLGSCTCNYISSIISISLSLIVLYSIILYYIILYYITLYIYYILLYINYIILYHMWLERPSHPLHSASLVTWPRYWDANDLLPRGILQASLQFLLHRLGAVHQGQVANARRVVLPEMCFRQDKKHGKSMGVEKYCGNSMEIHGNTIWKYYMEILYIYIYTIALHWYVITIDFH